MNEEQRQLLLMLNPGSWPYLALPMKRSADPHNPLVVEYGFIVADYQPVIYLMNMWEALKKGLQRSEMPQRRYGSYSAIVRDGWRVD